MVLFDEADTSLSKRGFPTRMASLTGPFSSKGSSAAG